MSPPHRIRLQAAWKPAPDGRAWTRSFGRPTGVGPGDHIRIVIDRPAPCLVVLNDRPLATVVTGTATWRHDVTPLMLERNELELRLAVPRTATQPGDRSPLPEALGLVVLEIDASA